MSETPAKKLSRIKKQIYLDLGLILKGTHWVLPSSSIPMDKIKFSTSPNGDNIICEFRISSRETKNKANICIINYDIPYDKYNLEFYREFGEKKTRLSEITKIERKNLKDVYEAEIGYRKTQSTSKSQAIQSQAPVSKLVSQNIPYPSIAQQVDANRIEFKEKFGKYLDYPPFHVEIFDYSDLKGVSKIVFSYPKSKVNNSDKCSITSTPVIDSKGVISQVPIYSIGFFMPGDSGEKYFNHSLKVEMLKSTFEQETGIKIIEPPQVKTLKTVPSSKFESPLKAPYKSYETVSNYINAHLQLEEIWKGRREPPDNFNERMQDIVDLGEEKAFNEYSKPENKDLQSFIDPMMVNTEKNFWELMTFFMDNELLKGDKVKREKTKKSLQEKKENITKEKEQEVLKKQEKTAKALIDKKSKKPELAGKLIQEIEMTKKLPPEEIEKRLSLFKNDVQGLIDKIHDFICILVYPIARYNKMEIQYLVKDFILPFKINISIKSISSNSINGIISYEEDKGKIPAKAIYSIMILNQPMDSLFTLLGYMKSLIIEYNVDFIHKNYNSNLSSNEIYPEILEKIIDKKVVGLYKYIEDSFEKEVEFIDISNLPEI